MTHEEAVAFQLDDQFHRLMATQDDDGNWVIPEGQEAPPACDVYTVILKNVKTVLGRSAAAQVVNVARLTGTQLDEFHLIEHCPFAPPP